MNFVLRWKVLFSIFSEKKFAQPSCFVTLKFKLSIKFLNDLKIILSKSIKISLKTFKKNKANQLNINNLNFFI